MAVRHGSARVLMRAEVVRTDVLERNKVLIVAVSRPDKDVRDILPETTVDSSWTRQSRGLPNTTRSSHRLAHEFWESLPNEITNSGHASTAESCVNLDNSPVSDLFVVIFDCPISRCCLRTREMGNLQVRFWESPKVTRSCSLRMLTSVTKNPTPALQKIISPLRKV